MNMNMHVIMVFRPKDIYLLIPRRAGEVSILFLNLLFLYPVIGFQRCVHALQTRDRLWDNCLLPTVTFTPDKSGTSGEEETP